MNFTNLRTKKNGAMGLTNKKLFSIFTLSLSISSAYILTVWYFCVH
ncbi:MAG: hypothetical protein LBT10_00050 [Methanobrevibacter sp.]|nr:hypothetical protein [Methanobrevibacter sp.]